MIRLVRTFCTLIACTLLILSCSFQMKKTGSRSLPGLKNDTTVYYDKFGIPHIEAQNDDDMMYALGYVTASERLFQMDLLRRIGSGRLSEVLGKDLLKADILLRKLGLKRHANFLWEKYKKTAPPHMLKQIDSYYAGVNHYIKTQPLPLEMRLLRYKPEPFSMEDCIAAGGYMALSFAEGFIVDVLYTDLLDELDQKTVDSIFNRATYDPETLDHELPNMKNSEVISYTPSHDYYSNLSEALTSFKKNLGLFHGSNAWALSSDRSKSGKPLLASDPHIAFSQPGTWFEAHIKSPTYENYGHYLPILPFPGLAHNKNRAWGITMSNSDDLDFYREKFHPEKPDLVLYKGEYVKVEKIKEVIKVKGESDHIEEVVITPHGPIIDNTKFVKKGEPLSLKWAFLDKENNSALTFYLLSQSKTLSDLAPALKHASAPGFNFVFADSKGSIGWHVMGKIPIRARPGNGNTVLEGHSGLDEYKGFLSVMDNPHLYNPAGGTIVSANYKHQYKGKVPFIGLWQPKNRSVRIAELLSSKDKWDLEELKKVQTDEYVKYHSEVVAHITKDLEVTSETQKKALKTLKSWNGRSSVDDTAPSIYYHLFQTVTKAALFDELGKDRFESYLQGADAVHFFVNIEHNGNSKIWDDKTTIEKTESQSDIFQRAWEQSIKQLVERFGSKDPDHWKWGEIHTLTVKHPMGKFFPLTAIFNVGPHSIGGGSTQLNNMGHQKKDLSFDVVYGPSTRRLIDLSKPELSFGILPTGNSGVPTSDHYSDQAKMFSESTYRNQIMDIEVLKKTVHTKLVLKAQR